MSTTTTSTTTQFDPVIDPKPVPADPAVKKRLDEINAELAKLEGDRTKAYAEYLVALSATPAAKQLVVDQLQARTDALIAERSSLTPPPPPAKADIDKATAALKRSNWTDNGNGTWTNTSPFKHGENEHVPAGVTRPFGEAATLEDQRPKK